MNPYSFAIPTILIGSYLLDLIVELLNLSSLNPHLPKEFQGIYKPEKYHQSQDYLKTTTSFSLIQQTILLPLTLAFIILGGFNLLDTFSRSFYPNQIITGLVFFLLLYILTTLINLPFSLYSTFVIEAKFGFNKTTTTTYFLDLIKSTLLVILIGAPILAFIIWFFATLGPQAWLFVWAFLTAVQVFLVFIAPTVIMPLFNKFTPLPHGDLRDHILSYAQSQHFQLAGIFTMDGSRRSTKSNAFFTGFGTQKRIALFDTLIKSLTTQELVAVLAHEIGHYQKHHIHLMLVVSTLTTGITLFIFSRFISNPLLFTAFRMDHTSVYASLIFIAFLFEPVSRLLGIITNFLSSRHEFQADHFAATTFSADHLASALKKLTVNNLGNLHPHPIKVLLDYSHPPILSRLQKLYKS